MQCFQQSFPPVVGTMKYFSKDNLLSGSRKLDLKSLNLHTKPALPFVKDKLYDVIVIGGGTGGLSFAQEARKLGMSVALFDHVEPSYQ